MGRTSLSPCRKSCGANQIAEALSHDNIGTLTNRFELYTLVLGWSMAKFEEVVKMVNKEIVNAQLKQCSSFHGGEKYVIVRNISN